jgi:predicted Zn-dependent protease
MRYIKLFEGFKDNVLDFTKDHLAYLVDDNFEISTTNNSYLNKSELSIFSNNNYAGLCTKISIVKRSGFTWEEIVDRFSPYVYMLNKEYNILEIVFYQNGGRQYQYDTRKDIEELVSGEADQWLINKFYTMIRIIVK